MSDSTGEQDAEVIDAPPQQPEAPEKQNEATKRTMALALNERGVLVTTRFQEQWDVASAAFRSGTLGPGLKNTAQTWAIMQRGAELGFPLMTAVEYLYVVKGRIRMTPDGAKAKALASGLLEDFREYFEGTPGTDPFKAVCFVKRRGIPSPIVREFSIEDAKAAKLWMKSGQSGDSAWVTYYKRMLAARARGFGFGDAFRDVCGGLQVRERFDLDPGEVIGGVIVGAEPPNLRDITPQRSAPAGRHPVLAQLVGAAQPVEATPEPHVEAPQEAPVEREWSAAEAQAAILAEASRRTDGDPVAAQDLAREVTGGIAKVKTREAAVEAHAKLAAHPRFGDA